MDKMLSASQFDALTELVNIGFGRAAAALSAMVGQRITLDVPVLSLHRLEDLGDVLRDLWPGEVASVHQVFSGTVSGDAMMVLDYDSASVLLDLLTGGPGRPRRLTASDREALIEIGNILINAYVGSFGNVIQVQITFAVPSMRLDALEDLLGSLVIGADALRYALVAKTEFHLADGGVGGYVVMVMGLESLETLFAAMAAAGLLG